MIDFTRTQQRFMGQFPANHDQMQIWTMNTDEGFCTVVFFQNNRVTNRVVDFFAPWAVSDVVDWWTWFAPVPNHVVQEFIDSIGI